jgi:hypothetical protein
MFGFIKQIRALLKIKSEVGKMSFSELKTSEGRWAIIGGIVSIYGAVQGFIPAPLAAKISAGLMAFYIGSRAIVKAVGTIAKLTPSPKDDEFVAKVDAALNRLGVPKDSVLPQPDKAPE